MLAYAAWRLIGTVLALLAATVLTFVMVEASSDPLASLRARQPPVPHQTIEAERARLYLDRPPPERYWLWLTGIGSNHGDIGLLRGRFGPSVQGFDTGHEVWARLLTTGRLIAAGTVVSVVAAVVVGVAGAVRRNSKADVALSAVAFVALAIPTFWLAALLKDAGVWVNQRLGRRLFFTIGATSPDHDHLGLWGRVADTAGHLALPTLVVSVTGYALVSRFQRAAMLEVLDSDHVRLARAKGLRRRKVIRRHALRLALAPVTTMVALTVSGALTSSVVVEVIFGWRGLGRFLVSAVGTGDTYAVMAFVVVAGTFVLVANLVADLLYGVLDPRVRHG